MPQVRVPLNQSTNYIRQTMLFRSHAVPHEHATISEVVVLQLRVARGTGARGNGEARGVTTLGVRGKSPRGGGTGGLRTALRLGEGLVPKKKVEEVTSTHANCFKHGN
ncbi:hypothetical protein U1Q18_032413 [Sarracenia purpurea var. burkii]